MNKKIKKTLALKKKSQEFARIERSFESSHEAGIENGVVINYSSKLIQFVSLENFDVLETIVFPINHIEKIRFNKSDKYYERILRKEKVHKSITRISGLKLKNWKSFFESLTIVCIIIETEGSKNRTFHIGGVVKIKNKKIEFLYFDALGKVDETPYKIKYKNITKVTLKSRYAEVFQRNLDL